MHHLLLALLIIGLVGMGAELLLLRHTETVWELIPLVLIGSALATVAWHRISRGSRSIRALQATISAGGISAALGPAEGGYDPVAEILFNEFKLDGFFPEYDSLRAGSFSPLRFVPRDKKIVLGLVTTKTGEMETADELKRRIDEAARYVPLEQLALSPQCGFSSTVLGNNITVEAEIAKLALVVRVAGEVWG